MSNKNNTNAKYELYYYGRFVGVKTEQELLDMFVITKKQLRVRVEKGYSKNGYVIVKHEEIDNSLLNEWEQFTAPLKKYIRRRKRRQNYLYGVNL